MSVPSHGRQLYGRRLFLCARTVESIAYSSRSHQLLVGRHTGAIVDALEDLPRTCPLFMDVGSVFRTTLRMPRPTAAFAARMKQEQADLSRIQKEWFANNVAADIGQKEKRYDPATDTRQWRNATLPFPDAAAAWNDDGTVWVRFDASVPPQWVGKALDLHLGAVDDVDITYVNGHEVGRTWQDVPNFWKIPRKYAVPAELVTSTEVSVVVCIANTVGIGGMFGAPTDMSLAPAGDAAAVPISLAGTWQCKRGWLLTCERNPGCTIWPRPVWAVGTPPPSIMA